MANFANNKSLSKSISIASGTKSHAPQPLRAIQSSKWKIGKGTSGQVASFLIKTIALEVLRRFSSAKCPFIWTGLQGLQVFCYPPLKWIQCWNPFGHLVKGMQAISRPLLLLSIVQAFSDHSEFRNIPLDDTDNTPNSDDAQLDSEPLSGSPPIQCDENTRIVGENHQGLSSTDWIKHLCEKLETQGITLPDRINKAELERFYAAANGDSSCLFSSVKKTIRWRETYRILSGEELDAWSNMVFWHGLDMKHRPCLIIRLGLACVSLPSHDRPKFAQAVVSQVEYGVLHLLKGESPQITVLVDCHGLSSLRLPMQTLRYCCNVLQDHFPNVLGCLIVIRLPSVVRVIAQTFLQVLKPATKQKLRIEGQMYKKVVSECFQTLPAYLGGSCACMRCEELDAARISASNNSSISESLIDGTGNNFPSQQLDYQCDIDNHCTGVLRSAVVGILVIWVLIALIEGLYNPESRPFLQN